ncbi:MAG: hypothetical protein BIFFINMI_03383 [Phycisphaerae bacterium]|nr:hypothetical protein [Phycisphaerae bacterium]
MNQTSYDCPICGVGMARLAHCKLRCPNCGLTEDCTDLFEGSALVNRPMPRHHVETGPAIVRPHKTPARVRSLLHILN